MPIITLIGEKLAIEGREFIYCGPNNECRSCKLKTVCFNLKPGRSYTIAQIREKQHGCTLHEGNVVVVEVTELPIVTTIENDVPEDTTVKIDRKGCKSIGCVFYELCTNPALQKDKTYTVKKIYEKIDCPKGYELYRAELVD